MIGGKKNIWNQTLDHTASELLAEKMELEYQYEELLRKYEEQQYQKEKIDQLHENTRRLKHDMKNHMLVLANYLNQENVYEAKQYLSKVLDKLNHIYTYIETGNAVLNSCINTKLEIAHQMGITFKAEIENLSFSKLGSIDLTALLMNLLDNALEASQREERKEIQIQIIKKRGYETILVKNFISNSVLQYNKDLKTTKTQNSKEHGYGLVQIRSIVEMYHGMIDIFEEKGWFCCFIAFPLSD